MYFVPVTLLHDKKVLECTRLQPRRASAGFSPGEESHDDWQSGCGVAGKKKSLSRPGNERPPSRFLSSTVFFLSNFRFGFLIIDESIKSLAAVFI